MTPGSSCAMCGYCLDGISNDRCPECGYVTHAGPAFAHYGADEQASIRKALQAMRWTAIGLVAALAACALAVIAMLFFLFDVDRLGVALLWGALGILLMASIGVIVTYLRALWMFFVGASRDAELRRWCILTGISAIVALAAIGAGFAFRSPSVTSLGVGIFYSTLFTILYWMHLPVLSKLSSKCAARIGKTASGSWWAISVAFVVAIFMNAVHIERPGRFISVVSLVLFLSVLVGHTASFRRIERSLSKNTRPQQ